MSSWDENGVAASLYWIYLAFNICDMHFLAFLFIWLFTLPFQAQAAKVGENQDEEYNEERKKNDTNYNKGTKTLFPKETTTLLPLPPRSPSPPPLPLPFSRERLTCEYVGDVYRLNQGD